MLRNLLYVMLGGAAGAGLRYLVTLLCGRWTPMQMPLATLLVNLAGCFLLGLLIGLGQRYIQVSQSLLLMLSVGVCGAFTTFSTFTADAFRLLNAGAWGMMIAYMAISIVGGFSLFVLGRTLILH